MSHAAPPPVDTRRLFRPVSSELVTLLRRLDPTDWERPTIAGSWKVRDIVAHLVDLSFRRLSFHRDRMVPPPPSRPIASDRDFVAFINGLNAEWVRAAARFSPRVLTDLFEKASTELADWFESLAPDAAGLFGVSWAGEQASEGWFDVGREFTELWHHQEQIRIAIGARPLEDPRYLRAVIAIAVRALPHAFRDVTAAPGAALVLEVTGAAGSTWSLRRDTERWSLHEGDTSRPTTRVRLSDEAAWRLFFNAPPASEAGAAIEVEGHRDLAERLLATRAIVI